MLSAAGSYRHLLYDAQLETPLSYERIYSTELSNVVGKDIYITNTQYRDFIRNTVQLLRSPSSYSIALANPYEKLPSDKFFFFCKSKFYAISVSDSIRFCAESSIVTTVYDIIDRHWENNIPAENKDKERVIKRLLEVAEKE